MAISVAAISRARAECDKVWAEYGKASAEYNTIRAEFYKVCAAHASELQRFHAEQCDVDCPWDDKTLFPEVAAND